MIVERMQMGMQSGSVGRDILHLLVVINSEQVQLVKSDRIR